MLQTLAQKRLVVEIHRSDHRQFRSDHVGGIQPAPQPHFEHRDVESLVPEQRESHRRHGLEIRRVAIEKARRQQPFGGPVNRVARRREALRGDGHAVHPDPLGGFREVRRGV
jgi:hypothetical protein